MLSVFDKAIEWPFDIIRYPHTDSNVPYHQPAGVIQGQLQRYGTICNSFSAFKFATTQLVLRILSRGHRPAVIMKGWNAHLMKFNNDRITNYTRLRHWFRRMLQWAIHNPLQKKQQQIWRPKSKNDGAIPNKNIEPFTQIMVKKESAVDPNFSKISKSQKLSKVNVFKYYHTPFEKDVLHHKKDEQIGRAHV